MTIAKAGFPLRTHPAEPRAPRNIARMVALLFSTLLFSTLLFLTLLFLTLSIPTGCDSRPNHWNVLILVPDTVRADHLSVNGYAHPTSPVIDALAAEGANFPQAITVAPRTWQSFSSILTGLYPPRHGVRYIFDRPIGPDVQIFGSIFAERGYSTASFDNTPVLSEMTGGRGFDEYFFPKPRQKWSDSQVLKSAADWIAVHHSEPFAVFVRIAGAHWPYAEGEPLQDPLACRTLDHEFNRGTYGITRKGDHEGVGVVDEQAFRKLIWTVDFDEPTRLHMIDHYDGEIRRTDERIGELLENLRERGILDRTIVVVTSDHGESFGEHGYLQHGPRVDESVMRVPLIIRLPSDHPAASPGRRIDQLVRTVDILPTVLEAANVPVPPDLDGSSLMPSLRGAPLEERWAYGETGRSFMGIDPERTIAEIAGKHRMVRTADWKLVYKPDAQGGRNLLYDLRVDPGELIDVSEQQPAIVTRLRSHLDSVLALDTPRGPDREISPNEIERLRELGYVQ